jgi:hypothetical protein
MRGVRRVCPACWAYNRAVVSGSRDNPSRCAFCANELVPAPQVLGANWRRTVEGART